MTFILVILAAYLLGSIPFSYLFSKVKGIDPRKEGSKNVGATNTLVIAGPLPGILALVGDVAKGFLAVQLARYFDLPDWGIAFCGLASIVGHDFPVFLKFKGGKGVATTAGVVLAMAPLLYLLALLLWGIVLIVLRCFIPSTVLVICFVPMLMWLSSQKTEYIFFGVFSALLAVYVHRDDLKRFFDGKELTVQESIAKYLKK